MSAVSDNELPLVLLVDDDARLRDSLARAMASRGYAVRTAGNYDAAMVLARELTPEYAVVDLRMPGPSGLELVRGLKELDPETR
ncbi:MAG: Fis family DNA-binding response regulator, partial [Pseudomonadota bacterium]